MASEYQATITISDYKRIIRELNKIETELTKELKANFRRIGQIPRNAVKESIPDTPPITGMRRVLSPVGKTWNTKRRASTVLLKLASPKRATGALEKSAAIIKLQVVSPATIIADMAGRGKVRTPVGTKTDWYVYPRAKSGERRHTVTSQGDAMIEALGGKGSRYVYPAVEDVMPETADEIYNVLGEAEKTIERKING